jgi:hypothetical protein
MVGGIRLRQRHFVANGFEHTTSSMSFRCAQSDNFGGQNRTRTCDLPDVSRMLYQLSYLTETLQIILFYLVQSEFQSGCCDNSIAIPI